MTDLATDALLNADVHTSQAARARLAKRYRREAQFKYLGMAAIGVAVLFLSLLLFTVGLNAYKAFSYTYVNLPVALEQADIDPDLTGDLDVIGKANFGKISKDAMKELLPFAKGRKQRRALYGLMTSDLGIQVRQAVLDDPSLIGTAAIVPVQLDDVADLYFKGDVTSIRAIEVNGTATPNGVEDTIEVTSSSEDFTVIAEAVDTYLKSEATRLKGRVAAKERSKSRLTSQVKAMEGRIEAASQNDIDRLNNDLSTLKDELATAESQVARDTKVIDDLNKRIGASDLEEVVPSQIASFILKLNGGAVKVTALLGHKIRGDVLIPLENKNSVAGGQWSLEMLVKPEDNRKLSDRSIVWLDHLSKMDLVERKFNSVFFSAGASREPEQAGILGAIMGSIYTMIVTLLLSFPVGVGAAIYLEEFAPKNWVTKWIEVNINNLAAVPSIVFGLLGLAVFLNLFGLPRSAPLVGGMVLALMTLPTIIIASRAALRSVPPSIREAALGVGASRLQTVTHHVLPLAMPGILTGTILGMAQALGETAPLLMIGMVAFIVDIPGGPLDPATVLPVQIFMWADFPEPAFQQKTSAAILVLLAFLVIMNALAVVLRKRFERRW